MDFRAPNIDALPSLRTLFSDRSWPEPTLRTDSALRGETILVTGAGGSLGRTLIQALRKLPVRRILAVDTSEHVLVHLQSQFSDGPPPVKYVLGDLRHDTDRQRALTYDPDVVIHAAAYKHVPFLESRPVAAAQNNLLTTVDWERACREAGIDRFVFVSTDKAVAPTSVMGRTKRWGERWLHWCRAQTNGTSDTPTYTTLRLCNLFGSRGSVVPRFLKRLRAGDMLPLTQPDMHRWFMTREDTATATINILSEPPGTYVPTACLYVSIKTLARRLIRRVRPTTNPDAWIRWVGRRPGERLHESRWADREDIRSVEGATLSRVVEASPPVSLPERIAALRTACAENDGEAVQSLLQIEDPVTETNTAFAQSTREA